MIFFDLFTRIHFLHHQDKLTGQQIAQKLSLNPKTVAKGLGLGLSITPVFQSEIQTKIYFSLPGIDL